MFSMRNVTSVTDSLRILVYNYNTKISRAIFPYLIILDGELWLMN